jgi:large subunit ribosomal protein L9
MEVILLESVRKLGSVGTKVRVKDGYGRNFLIPRKKALRATKENIAFFEDKKSQIEQENNVKKEAAQTVAVNLNDLAISLIRQAAEDGRLFGSVTSREVELALKDKGFEVERSLIVLNTPIKTIGIHKININLHPDVPVSIRVNVARTDAEAIEAAKQ